MDLITLSPDQELAAGTILHWWQSGGKLIKLAGFAGTGKSTVCRYIIQRIRSGTERQIRVAYCAFTGKAAQILASKVELEDGDTCSTIHSLIYLPVVKDGVVKRWKRNPSLDADLIVVDEASMVDEVLFKDLEKFGIPIMAVGDHGQLPPVKGDFNLMEKPDVRLEKIHRQAEGNPIIGVSVQARRNGSIAPGEYGPGVEKRVVPSLFPALEECFDKDALYLCAFNSTRCYLNKFYRQRMNIASAAPVKGEKVICLRNNREAGIFNGQTGILKDIKSDGAELYLVKIQMDDGTVFEGDVSRFQFGQRDVPKDWNVYKMGNLFDFGYAVTVHKAQGSQARKVVLVEERGAWNDDYHARWVYTAVTRASEELLVLSK